MENLFLTIVNMSITATWAVLVFTLLRPLLKKVPKWVNCFLWGIVALRLCLPFSLESVFSLIPTAETIPTNITTSANPQIDTGVGVVNSVVNPVISDSFTPDPSYSVNPLQVVVSVASYIWIVGLVLMVIYCAVSYIMLKRKVSASVHYNNNIYYCDNIETPFILGVIKPKIYIPSGVNENDLQFILEHEKSHIKRKDYLIKPLSFLILSVYWFNPAIWLWYILLCRDIESACDEKAIKFYDSEYKKLYSTALLNCSTQKRIIMACPVAFGETGVKQRIKSVLNYKNPATWVVGFAIILTVWLTIFFVTNPENSDFNNIIDEKGYEVICVEPSSISMTTIADNILTRSPEDESNGLKLRFKIYETEAMEVFLEKVDLSEDKKDLFLTFSIEYNDLNDWGIIYSPYYKTDKGYSYFLNMGDKVGFYSVTGFTGQCLGEVVSLGSGTEFVVKIEKEWLEKSKDSKISIDFKIGEITYKKNDLVKDKLALFLDTELAEAFDSGKDDKNFNCIDYKIIDEVKNGRETTIYMSVLWQEYFAVENQELKLIREYHYPVSLTYKNDGELFSKNGFGYKLVRVWIPENDSYNERVEFSNNFSNEAYNRFVTNKTNFYNYHKNSCLAMTQKNFEMSDNQFLIYADANTEGFTHIKDNYYYAVIDKTSEYSGLGLYLCDENVEMRFICELGTTFLQGATIGNTFYYIADGYMLHKVVLNEISKPDLFLEELYNGENTYSIENIELVSGKYIYCEAKHRGLREEYPDWDLVYLKINTGTEEFVEIKKNEIPKPNSDFSELVPEIEKVLNATTNNIFVQRMNFNFESNGSFESGLITVQFYDKTSNGFARIGNILIAEDFSVFFNEYEDFKEVAPLGKDRLTTIDKILEKVNIIDNSNFCLKNIETTPDSFQLIYFGKALLENGVEREEPYTLYYDSLSYVFSENSKAKYFSLTNNKIKKSSKPTVTERNAKYISGKEFFILTPYYKTEEALNKAFEDSSGIAGDLLFVSFDEEPKAVVPTIEALTTEATTENIKVPTSQVFKTDNISRITFYSYYGSGKGSVVPAENMTEIINWLGSFKIDKKAPDILPPGTGTNWVEIEYSYGTVVKKALDYVMVDGVQYKTKSDNAPGCYWDILSKTSYTTDSDTAGVPSNKGKLVTSNTPPVNTTSPEGYTTPYVDYFTPEGERVFVYYVFE